MDPNEKYDRQLRLWGANGQRSLMESHILLVNAEAVGTEVLKNLVLPGVGKFTILDSAKVVESDLGKNFFVSREHIGMNRAQVVSSMLSEMNPDVKGCYRADDCLSVLHKDPAYFSQFSLIICSNLSPDLSLSLSLHCWDKDIPLILLRAYGLIGTLRVQYNQLEVIESRVEADTLDLRLTHPFPSLSVYIDSINLIGMDSNASSHVPWPVLLVKTMEKWKEISPTPPSNKTEKEKFKKMISELVITNDGGVNGPPENVVEAQKEAFRIFSARSLSLSLSLLLSERETTQVSKESTDFRVLLHAINIYRSHYNNLLPLSGALPDMTSSTSAYMELQKIFHEKAKEDRQLFTDIVNSVLQSIGRPVNSISQDYITLFIKNLLSLSVCATRPYFLEYGEREREKEREREWEVENYQEIMEDVYEEKEQTPLLWYLTLRAADMFYSHYRRWPGTLEDQVTTDADIIFSLFSSPSLSLSSDILLSLSHEYAKEITRYGASELHNIASIIGGVGGQEAVKILTTQYIPLNNTFVYNGVNGRGAVYKL